MAAAVAKPTALLYRRRPTIAEGHFEAVKRVIALLRSELDRTLSIGDMARAAYISPFHFIRVFEGVTGVTPSRFQCALKLQAAKTLLLSTDMKIVDVCYEIGYKSLGTFTRRFTELVGIAPNKFRHHGRMANCHAEWRRMNNETAEGTPFIEGYVAAPDPHFEGVIVIGAFPTAVPQGCPLNCAVANRNGQFRLPRPPAEEFYVCGLGLRTLDAMAMWIVDDSALRGVRCHAPNRNYSIDAGSVCTIALRRALPTDPPILTALGAFWRHD